MGQYKQIFFDFAIALLLACIFFSILSIVEG